MAAVYNDTTLTPEAGYTSVNCRQLYDHRAAQLAAHPAWSLVDTQDWVSGTTVWRTYVWKCAAAVSGLPNDFHVMFRVGTVAGVEQTSYFYSQIYMSEGYDPVTHIASQVVPSMNGTSFTINADHTCTLTLDTTTNMAAGYPAHMSGGPYNAATSVRVLMITDDDLFTSHETASNGASTPGGLYVGAIETLMTPADDPMPIMMGCNTTGASGGTFSSNGGTAQGFAATRHPKLPAGPTTYAFGFALSVYHTSNGVCDFGKYPLLAAAGSTSLGTLGDPAHTATNSFWDGVFISKIPVCSSGSTQSGKTRGGVRGFLKYYRTAPLTPHALGDTFLVDGAEYAGFGITYGGLLPLVP